MRHACGSADCQIVGRCGVDADACGVDRHAVCAARCNADRIGGGAVDPRIRVAVKAIGRKGRRAERGQDLVREDRVAAADMEAGKRRCADPDGTIANQLQYAGCRYGAGAGVYVVENKAAGRVRRTLRVKLESVRIVLIEQDTAGSG